MWWMHGERLGGTQGQGLYEDVGNIRAPTGVWLDQGQITAQLLRSPPNGPVSLMQKNEVL